MFHLQHPSPYLLPIGFLKKHIYSLYGFWCLFHILVWLCSFKTLTMLDFLLLEPDSLSLSLLMDNKGMDPLDVSITAPDYVTLAEDTVHVEANDHHEV